MRNKIKDGRLSRRGFLKSVAGTTTIALAPAFAAPAVLTSSSPNELIHYAFIGTGTRGVELLRSLTTIRQSRCVATCDIYPPNLKKGVETIGTNPETYSRGPTDYRRMLERRDIDAVFIATPLYLHASMLIDSLEAGKHVYIEKSMFFKERELEPIVQAARAHAKQVLQVGLQCRSNGVYQVAMEMIRRGALGKLTFAHAQWHRLSNWRRPVADPKYERLINWRMYREYSGGLMAEWASHQIDVVNWAFNSHSISIMGMGGIDYWKDGRETWDNIEAIFQYPEGRKLTYSAILSNSHQYEYEQICGDQGTLQFSMGTSGLYFREPRVNVTPVQRHENWWAGATVMKRAVEKGIQILPETEVVSGESGKAHIENFFAGIHLGKPVNAPLEVGITDALSVIYANRAIDTRQTQQWLEGPT